VAAIDCLELVLVLEGSYRDAKARLDEARRQKTLMDLDAQAHLLRQAQGWDAVLSVFARIKELEPTYPDPDGIETSAREALTGLKLEQQLGKLYRQGLEALNGGTSIVPSVSSSKLPG
jgi:hypothetical protein